MTGLKFLLGKQTHSGLRPIVIIFSDFNSKVSWHVRYLVLTNFPPTANLITALSIHKKDGSQLISVLNTFFYKSLLARICSKLEALTKDHSAESHAAIYEHGPGLAFEEFKLDYDDTNKEPLIQFMTNLTLLNDAQLDLFLEFSAPFSREMKQLQEFARDLKDINVTEEASSHLLS